MDLALEGRDEEETRMIPNASQNELWTAYVLASLGLSRNIKFQC